MLSGVERCGFLRSPVTPKRLVVRHTATSFAGFTQPGHWYVRADIGERFPAVRPGGPDSLRVELASPEEALVYVLGRELRHLWQYWYDGGTLSDLDADMWALERLTEWRQIHQV